MPESLQFGRPARDAVLSLLAASGLPTTDLAELHLENFLCIGPTQAPAGIVGLELYGADALLRSLAVDPARRSAGLGSALVARAEADARARGVRSVYLLTTTAESFFLRRGYAPASRDDAPAAIRGTREFAELCPSESVFLFKQL